MPRGDQEPGLPVKALWAVVPGRDGEVVDRAAVAAAVAGELARGRGGGRAAEAAEMAMSGQERVNPDACRQIPSNRADAFAGSSTESHWCLPINRRSGRLWRGLPMTTPITNLKTKEGVPCQDTTEPAPWEPAP